MQEKGDWSASVRDIHSKQLKDTRRVIATGPVSALSSQGQLQTVLTRHIVEDIAIVEADSQWLTWVAKRQTHPAN
jgi:hypothetical protein